MPKTVLGSATALGALAPETEITFVVGLPSQDPGGLQTAAKTASSGGGGLSPSEEASLYGAPAADVQAVQAFMTGQGFILDGESPNGLGLQFTGSAAEVESTFRTTLERYAFQGHVGYAPVGALSLPVSLAGDVQGVLGLDTLVQPVSMLKGNGRVGTPSASGSPYSALQMETAYHMAPLFQQGYEGQGETIGVATFAPYDLSDVEAFDQQMGLPAENLVAGTSPYVVVDGTSADVQDQAGSDETSVDLEWSHSFAPMAQQEVAVGDDTATPSFPMELWDVFSDLAFGQHGLAVPDVITISWGYAEADEPLQTNQVLDNLFASIAAQGITMFAASGDGDVVDENVLFPASDPFVIAVGGTQVQLNTDGTIASEPAWGGTAANVFYTASTGGYSEQFGAPSWAQEAQSTYTPGYGEPYLPGMRGVPDVSLNAVDLLGYWQGSWWSFDGTSLSSPSWAGIFADIDQLARAKTGRSIGYLAPQLYYAAENDVPSPFHDITTGTNGVYAAAPGWDPVTGLGTPDVAALASDLVANAGIATVDSGGPFITAVSTNMDPDWDGAMPLTWVADAGQIANLSDTLVPGTYACISGGGFGSGKGSVSISGAGDSIRPAPTIESWNDNLIVVLIPASLSAAPQPEAYEIDVATASGKYAYALSELTGAVTLDAAGPLGVDTPAAVTVGGAAYMNVADVLPDGLSAIPSQVLVTLADASATRSGATVEGGTADGLSALGFPEYLVQPSGGRIAIDDDVAEYVDVIVQDPAQPRFLPAQAALEFTPGAPAQISVVPSATALWDGKPGQSDVVQGATYDPSQATPFQIQLLDGQGNPITSDPGFSFDVAIAGTTSAAVYQEASDGSWTPATTVGGGVYSVLGDSGAATIALTDPQPGQSVSASVYGSGLAAVPLVGTGGALSVTASVYGLPPSSPYLAVGMQYPSVGPEGFNVGEISFSDPSARGTAYVSVGGGVTVFDVTTTAEMLPDAQGLYEIPIADGQGEFAFVGETAGKVPITAYFTAADGTSYSASATAEILPGEEAQLSGVVLNAAVVSGDASIGLPGTSIYQQVFGSTLDEYGNPTDSSDTIGLTVSAPDPSALTVLDENGDPVLLQGGAYGEAADQGNATFYVYSSVPQEVDYQLTDETNGSVTGVGSGLAGDFLSPYATQLDVSAGTGVAEGAVWAATPELVQISVADQAGAPVTANTDTVDLTITPPAGASLVVQSVPSGQAIQGSSGTYAVPLVDGTAEVAVTSSVAGQIGYSVADATTPSVSSTNTQGDTLAYPLDFSPSNPLTVSSGGTATTSLVAGDQYTITATFQNYGTAMGGMPILEVVGSSGVTMEPVGFFSSQIEPGGPIEAETYFTPPSSGTYTVEAFLWSGWIDNGGQPLAPATNVMVTAR